MGNSILEVISKNSEELIEKSLKYVEKFDNSSYGKYWKDLIEEIVNGR